MGRPLNALQNTMARAVINRLRSRKRPRSGSTYSKTQYKKRSQNYGGLLGGSEADRKSVYRRKRMPRRRRVRWKRFVRKVNAVSEKTLGSRTVLFNDQIDQENTTIDKPQSSLTLALYPMKSTVGFLNDLQAISGIENAANPTAALGETVNKTSKFLFQSGVFDVTIRNTSTFFTSTDTKVLDARAAIELDVYEFIHSARNPPGDMLPLPNLSDVLEYSDDPNIGGGGNDIDIYTRGATPFEFGRQMALFGCKVIKKTKYFIPNNQTITHQFRDPARHVFSQEQLNKNSSWANNVTRTFFLVYKFVPGIDKGSTLGTFQLRINVGCSRKYMYKIEGMSDSRHRALGGNYIPVVNC